MSDKKLTWQQLANMIDHTNLKQYVPNEAFEKLCDEAKQYGFKTVAINCATTEFCYGQLKDTPVLVDSAVGFPLGQSTLETKVFETEDAIRNGAGEIDYVANLVELKNKNYDYIRREMDGIVEMCRKYQVTSKVIFENCYLTEDEIVKMAEIALEIGIDFIKTSTGFGEYGAKAEHVRLMKSVVGDKLKVKAAGGIRDVQTALAMIDAGASRIGTSSGIRIVEDYKKMTEE